MIADAPAVESAPLKTLSLDSSLLSLGSLESEQTLKTFLAKPIIVQSGTFANSDTVSTFTALNVGAIFNSNMWAEKLYGYMGIRATQVWTLQVNATRFQQGRYMLNFYPIAGSMNASNAAEKKKFHNYTLCQRTQVPHEEIDLSTQTKATLRVPYINSLSYYPLAADATRFSPGTIQIHPYIPLNSGSASYSLWVHLEDVQLFTATVPQSRKMFRKKNNSETEQASQGMGPVQGTLRSVSQVAEIAGKIPVLSAFAEPVQWISNIAGDIASVFGWSKPVNLDHTTRYTRGRGYFLQNYNGPDNSAILALSSENSIQTLPSFASSDLDEMSFDYIKQIPAYFSNVTWTTTDAKETLLKTIDLEPATFVQSSTDDGQTIYSYPPCSFPNIFFSKWRGSFNITMKIVKTEFHSGRLMVAFEPYMGESCSTPTSNFALTNYLHREIIDVRDQTTWTFSFPYSHPFIYKSNLSGRPYGKVYVYVVDALVAPATVSSSVNILFEVSGAPDLEYAFPRATTLAPYCPTAPQSSGMFSAISKPPIVKTVGTASDFGQSIAPAGSCIGEKFLSFRQLLKRIQFRPRTDAINGAACYNYLPFAWTYATSTLTVLAPPKLAPDMYNWCCSMYALARGGVRYRLFSSENTSVTANVTYLLDAQLYGTQASLDFWASATDWYTRVGPVWLAGGPSAILDSTENITGDIQVPMYSSSYAFCIADTMISGPGGSVQYQIGSSTAPPVLASTQLLTGLTSAPCPMRGGSDDMSFGCFVSIPPVVDIASELVNNWT